MRQRGLQRRQSRAVGAVVVPLSDRLCQCQTCEQGVAIWTAMLDFLDSPNDVQYTVMPVCGPARSPVANNIYHTKARNIIGLYIRRICNMATQTLAYMYLNYMHPFRMCMYKLSFCARA